MAINKIDRVVLHEDVKEELDNKATKQELQSTKEELINSMNEVYQGISWKPTVPTFDDLRKHYPNAKDGWTATVGDTNITYQYDLETDSWFPTSINALPLVTAQVDGLMVKEDKVKLDTVEKDAQKNLTPQQILEQIKTVDGKGSGLDTDLFQGRLPDTFADKEHEHDGFYYKKSEVNSFLNDKSPKGHVHSKEQITDFKHNHSPSEIIENATKRFVSNAEKTNWNDANTKKHTHSNKSILDTITQTLIDKWNSAVEHIKDSVRHITSTERTKWNTVDNKVDKVTGKGLSDENYTLVEKDKLAEIESGANKYIHPSTHSANMIGENENKRFVSDAEKADWNAKETPTGAQEKASLAETNAKAYTDAHDSNIVKHITVTERTNWNNKPDMVDIPTKVGQLENDKNYVTSDELGSAGYGDMMKSIYDKNGDGIVDRAEIANVSESANAIDWAKVNNKPSVFNPSNHEHSEYVKKTGDTITGGDLYIDGGSVNYIRPGTTGGWARGFWWSKRDKTRIGGIGVLGSGNLVSKFYIGYGISPWTNSILEAFPEYINVNGDIKKQGISLATFEDISTKVDKVTGKQLSTEDYTTAEKTKLAEVEAKANNYKHPATHPVDMIVGLHSIAKSGNYNELNGKPTKLSQFQNDVKPYHKGSTPPANTNLLWIKTIVK